MSLPDDLLAPEPDAERWGLARLADDHIGRRLDHERRAAAVRVAVTHGTEVARAYRAAGQADPHRLAAVLRVEVVWSDESPALGTMLRIAEYQPRPATIRLFAGPIATIRASAHPLPVADIYLAHELFHHLEATALGPASALARVTLGRLGPWRWDSGVPALSEIAAHAFAQALLGLPVFTGSLDRLAAVLRDGHRSSLTPQRSSWRSISSNPAGPEWGAVIQSVL